MKALLFGWVFLLPCALAQTGAPPLTDPWAVLERRGNLISADVLAEAKQAVFAEAMDTRSKTVARLVRLWKDNSSSHPATMAWACELAGPKEVGMIFQAVREVLKREDDPQHPELTDRLNRFFFDDCRALWDKLADPELLVLVQLLEEGGRTIWHLPFSPAERDRLMLAKLREQRDIVVDEWPRPWPGLVSSNALAGLLRFANDELHGQRAEVAVARLSEERCQIALDTLASRSAVEALPLFKELLAQLEDTAAPAALIHKLEFGAAKLEHEHDADRLLEIANTERNNAPLLHWAAWRYLMIGGELGKLHEALAGNRALAEAGRHAGEDITASMRYVMFGEGSDSYVTPDGKQVIRDRDLMLGAMVSVFLLDGEQQANMRELMEKAQHGPDSEAASEEILKGTYRTILERAKL